MVDHAGVENVGVGVEEVSDLEVGEQVIGLVLCGVGDVEAGGRRGVVERVVDWEKSWAGKRG